ncbi:imidazolonepropionase [Tieghemostelium lacteum]|uniref:Probable imidazolonepropionase n=1 Tax=Tieghemostelium lacteum TaxID=361077 RepID=A0A152A8H1_TIELA|nr:imidazolonepropionase [Tieghemostelium lacteum]|eukprot:KYR02540.1 imidazolonepropionase [Tieghemostelium lacteum]
MFDYRLKIKNASQIVVITSNKKPYLIGKDMSNIEIVENSSMIVDNQGKIIEINKNEIIEEKYSNSTFERVIDCTGKSIIPGFVDGHTHPVFSGDRVHEFAMKLAGATYLDVHKAGGGIQFTVQHTRQSTEKELLDLLLARLDRMLKHGTTTIEAKSGYGLETETEMKMLKVLHQANKTHPIDIVSTYLGAHSIPKGLTAQEATDDIINNQLPELKRLKELNEISPSNIDVFLEKGIYEQEHSKQILNEGKKLGLNINFHGDELTYQRSGEIGEELQALAISHLEKVSEEGMIAMSKTPTFAVLLPTTAYILRLEVPPARRMIELNVPVALGSDFNPNAHCMSMPFVMNLACVLMKMNMSEALVAATLNSAASLGLSKSHGSLEVGKYADMLIINNQKWEHIIYELIDPPIQYVIKNGNILIENK